MEISELMSAPVVTVRRDATVERVARTMLEHGIGSVVVVDEGGACAGIVTERDFVEKEGHPWTEDPTPRVLGVPIPGNNVVDIYEGARQWPIGRIMRAPVLLAPSEPVEKCLDLMRRHGNKHLVVVDGGKPVGLVSHHDFLRLAAGTATIAV